MNEMNIDQTIQTFILHLEKKGYAKKTIQRSKTGAVQYLKHLQSKSILIKEADYKTLLNFIGNQQQEGKSKYVINEYLRAISLLYKSLQLPDLAFDTRLRGIEDRTYPMLSEEELDNIYQNFTPHHRGHYRYSDKIMLGFIIYQALDVHDIYRIETTDVKLHEGKIYIPGGNKRKASRWLDLQAHQVLQLHEFITTHRKPYKEEHGTNEKLFMTQAEKFHRLHGQLKQLMKQVKLQAKEKHNIEVLKLSQLAKSRIAIWIKQHGLRKAQYMAGYKRPGNVERYKQLDISDLTEQVNKFHPLK
jgi:integrase/recombinase XerD